MLLTDHFSRRADVFSLTASELTAEDTANILVYKYIILWGCLCAIFSENGLQFGSKRLHAVYHLLGVRKLAPCSYHPHCNKGVERVNHNMVQVLAMVVNGQRDEQDLRLPHV